MNKDVQAFIYGSSIVTTILAIVSFLRGRRDTAIFLGLWAPTAMARGAFFNSERPPYSPADDAEPRGRG